MVSGSFREKVNKRLRSSSGESLSETLVALLLAALALAMLAGVIASGARMINAQKDKLEKYYSRNEAVVNMTADYQTGSVTFDFEGNDDPDAIPVNLYTNDVFSDKPVITYKVQPPSQTP